MNFTPRIDVRAAFTGVLIVAVVGLISSVNQVAPVAAHHDSLALPGSLQTGSPAWVIPAVQLNSAPRFGNSRPEYYPVSSWYKNKHWWKRNAPIVGGVGGGALIGGLAGGGTGALIGGAVGGAGGYAYKHYHHHHHYHNHYY
jgi:hypothetical protein